MSPQGCVIFYHGKFSVSTVSKWHKHIFFITFPNMYGQVAVSSAFSILELSWRCWLAQQKLMEQQWKGPTLWQQLFLLQNFHSKYCWSVFPSLLNLQRKEFMVFFFKYTLLYRLYHYAEQLECVAHLAIIIS